MGVHLEICDAVVTRLNSTSWSPTFTAVRRWPAEIQSWKTETGELDTLKVSVTPFSRSREIATRAPKAQRIYLVKIVLQLAMPLPNNDNIDPLDLLAETITDWMQPDSTGLKSLALSGGVTALWQAVDVDPVYDEESMVKRSQYMGEQVHAYVVVK